MPFLFHENKQECYLVIKIEISNVKPFYFNLDFKQSFARINSKCKRYLAIERRYAVSCYSNKCSK